MAGMLAPPTDRSDSARDSAGRAGLGGTANGRGAEPTEAGGAAEHSGAAEDLPATYAGCRPVRTG